MKIILILIFFSKYAFSQNSLRAKYPNELLSDDYGVLTEKDLLADENGIAIAPYKIHNAWEAFRRWQCFESKKLLFHYHTWKDSDPYGALNEIATLCLFSFDVTDSSGIKHSYLIRRAKDVKTCQMFFHKWKKIRKNEKYVCISGSSANYEDGVKYWFWGKIKTKKKCMAYFENECV